MQKIYAEAKVKWPAPDNEAQMIIDDYVEIIATLKHDLSLTADQYYEKVYAYSKTLWRQDRIVTNDDFRRFVHKQLKELELELQLLLNNPKLFTKRFFYNRSNPRSVS